MSIHTITSRAFNQDPTSAKRAALSSPVQITERGKVSHVLLSIAQYQAITNTDQNIAELLGMPNDIEFEPTRIDSLSVKPAELD